METGIILSQETSITTEVSGGTKSNPSVKSSTITKKSIWLKTDDGREVNFNLSEDVSTREGQRISVIGVEMKFKSLRAGLGLKEKVVDLPVLLVNHTSRTWSQVSPIVELACARLKWGTYAKAVFIAVYIMAWTVKGDIIASILSAGAASYFFSIMGQLLGTGSAYREIVKPFETVVGEKVLANDEPPKETAKKEAATA